jgi:hypothetical protein
MNEAFEKAWQERIVDTGYQQCSLADFSSGWQAAEAAMREEIDNWQTTCKSVQMELDRLRQPQTAETCQAVPPHPRACLQPLIVGPDYGALGRSDPSLVCKVTPKVESHGNTLTMTSSCEAVQVCTACEAVKQALDKRRDELVELIYGQLKGLPELRETILKATIRIMEAMG